MYVCMMYECIVYALYLFEHQGTLIHFVLYMHCYSNLYKLTHIHIRIHILTPLPHTHIYCTMLYTYTHTNTLHRFGQGAGGGRGRDRTGRPTGTHHCGGAL